jgi:hypothetical protein
MHASFDLAGFWTDDDHMNPVEGASHMSLTPANAAVAKHIDHERLASAKLLQPWRHSFQV